MFPLAFVPRVDVERRLPFLPAHPEDLVAQRKFNQVPLILGVTKNEGALVSACKSFSYVYIFIPLFVNHFACLAALFMNENKHMNEFKADPIGTIRYMIQMENQPNGQEMAQLVHDHLFTLEKPYEDQKQQVELVSLHYFNRLMAFLHNLEK